MSGKQWAVYLLIPLVGAGCSAMRCRQGGENPEQRAGYPFEVAPWAHPSDTGAYTMYRVGGGAPGPKGDGPHSNEGTWGWDYLGRCIPSHVILGWFHGRRYQGGTGAYETDGPRPLEHLKEGGEKEGEGSGESKH